MVTAQKRRLTLSTQVMIALAFGIAVGIVSGEHAGFLQLFGKAFILLLQMTVLPYITLSLISGLGKLTLEEVKSLALKVGFILVLSWLLAFAVILASPLAYPDWTSATFFSTSLIEKPPEVNFLQLYIPSNPFFSLANNIVPAAVVFSIAVGVALIGVPNKMTLIEPLTILSSALMKVTTTVAKLTPYGVFAIVASTAGTMGLEELGRLQVFLITYMVLALLLTFGILPIMVTSLTPLSYRQVVGQTRDVLITAFATGSGLIVLPLIIERTRDLLRTGHLGDEETAVLPDVIIPAFFNFPKIGTLLPMSFVLFAGWFSGAMVSAAQYPIFITSGLASFFGSVNVAIPFLLDLLRIPADMFQLYVATSVITGRFGVMLAVMHSLVLALLGSCAVSGLLTLRWGRIVRNLILSVAVTVVALLGCRLLFSLIFDNAYDKDKMIAGMQLLRHPGPATVFTADDPPTPLPPLASPRQSRLERVRQRGVLRAGYRTDALPNSYFNGDGQLVGFDIDMAYVLAKDLKVDLEFVPVETAKMAAQLDRGDCDIVMSGVAITPERALEMAFSNPYIEETMALVVTDHRRDAFRNLAALKRMQPLRLAVPDVPYYIDKLKHYLPQAEVTTIPSVQTFFKELGGQFDGLVFSAEAGSAWSLLYPSYTVVVPQPRTGAIPMAFPIAKGDLEMVAFINNWLALKKQDGTIQAFYDYWILGKNAVPVKPRWSVIRNVLHWGD
jgi:proton glutamate symport protein